MGGLWKGLNLRKVLLFDMLPVNVCTYPIGREISIDSDI